jgi:hypothetical protein
METKKLTIKQIVNAKSVGKTLVTAAAAGTLGSVAIPAGATAYLVSKAAQKFCENEDTKEVLEFIADVGGSTAMGGQLGSVLGTVSCNALKEFGNATINEETRASILESMSLKRETLKKVESFADSLIDNRENIENEIMTVAKLSNSSGMKLIFY